MKKRLLFVIVLLIGLTLYCFGEALFFNKVLACRDLGRYFYPLRLFTVSCVKAGTIPLWNPYIFCGAPHLALQQSVIFYPLSLIYYLFPFDLAFNLFLLAHIPLAGTLCFLLCRRWGLGYSPSLISAVTFMLNGFTVSLLNLATTLSSVVWLPAALLFFDRALGGRSAKDLLAASFFLGVMFLGGEPSIFYTASWILLFYAVFFWLQHRPALSFKSIAASYIAVIITSGLLSAVQLVPLIEFLGLSDRAVHTMYDYVTRWSFPIKDTMDFFIPFFARTDFSTQGYWHEQNWAFFVYAGVYASMLPLFAVFLRKRDWRVGFLCFIGALSLLAAYGKYTPFHYLIYKFIPGFRYVRYPVRFLHVTVFAVAMLCAFGFDAYLKERASGNPALKRFFKKALYILLLLSAILLAVDACFASMMRWILNFCSSHNIGKDTSLAYMIAFDIKNAGRFIAFFVAAGMVLFMALHLKIRQGFVSFAIVSLVIADLVSALPQEQFLVRSGVFHAPPRSVEYLKRDRSLFRFFVAFDTKESSSFMRGLTYEDCIVNSKKILLANLPVIFGLYDIGGYDSAKVGITYKLMLLAEGIGSQEKTRVFDMLNGKYLVSSTELAVKGYRLAWHGEGAYIYENTKALPRAFLVGAFKVLKKERDIAAAFKSKEFDPAKEVILEEAPNEAYSVQRTAYSERKKADVDQHRNTKYEIRTTNDEKVEITKHSPNEVIVKTIVNSPKFLVLGDTYYPGWKAYVDGSRQKIYKANYMIRAVHLRPGVHTVRFVFDPFSFKLGASLSALTLIFIAAYIAIRRK